MPELPEVETIKLGLQKYLVGHIVKDVDIKVAKLFEGDKKNVIGAKVVSIDRRGKGLIINLSNNYSLAIHIKLTGQFIYRDKSIENVQVSKEKVGTLPSSATHVIFKLDKGATLFYNDRRKFGWIKVIKTDKVDELPFFKSLGPEPFKDLTLEKFQTILSKSSVAVKLLIMDQKRIGGIGNIYANDALFMAGINPKRPAKSLNQEEVKDLYNAVLSVMEKSFKYGGASELNFVNVLGQEGEYQNHSLVYGKQGQKCPKDGEIIKKYFLGGRGTYVCEKHQK